MSQAAYSLPPAVTRDLASLPAEAVMTHDERGMLAHRLEALTAEVGALRRRLERS